MRKVVDLTGQTFGRLKVESLAEPNSMARRGAHWNCLCICGNRKTVHGTTLRRKQTTSCGCWRKDRMHQSKFGAKAPNLAAFMKLIHWAKSNADRRGITFSLTHEECRELFKSNCFYCGIEPHRMSRTAMGAIRYNGIDRVDSSKPYTPANCVAACSECNRAKRNMRLWDFLNMVARIYDFSLKGRI